MTDTLVTDDAPVTTVRQWTLAAHAADKAREVIEAANRRARRAGLAAYVYAVEAAPPVPVFDDARADGGRIIDGIRWPTRGGEPCRLIGWDERITVTVTGEVPRVAGWDFVAVVERDEHAGTLTRAVPGVEVNLDALRSRDASECDHCRTRRERAKVYALRNAATGELKQVGSSCLTLFLGIEVSISDAVFSRSLDDEMDSIDAGGFGGGDRSFDPADVLAIASFVISEFGWVSRSNCGPGDLPTADRVIDALDPRSTGARKWSAHVWDSMSDADRERGAAVLAYAREITPDTEYTKNLSQVATADRIGVRNVPLLASAVTGYNRHIERILMERGRQSSTHQGVAGERWIFPALTVTRVSPFETEYGLSYFVKMTDRDGNVFTWRASTFGYEPGDVIDVTATVKEHAEWQGGAETKITRAKVTDAPYGPALPNRPAKPAKRPRKRAAQPAESDAQQQTPAPAEVPAPPAPVDGSVTEVSPMDAYVHVTGDAVRHVRQYDAAGRDTRPPVTPAPAPLPVDQPAADANPWLAYA